MRKLVMIGTIALASVAGTASADLGFHIGSGLSFGFCGSGFSISSGFSIGGHGYHRGYGHGYGYYRPSIGWYDAGSCGWDRPRYRSSYRHWDNGWNSYHRPRVNRRSRGDCWSDAELSAPVVDDVIATHDRKPNRAPEIKDEVSVEDRTADAWKLLEQGEANRAQGFFALAAAKDPDDAVVKLGFALASADMGDDVRAAWSAERAINVDEGELATLELGSEASVMLADLIDSLQSLDSDLAVDIEQAMPLLVTLPAIASAE
jgi:hypothetical protein